MSLKKDAGKRGPSLSDVAKAAGVNRVTASIALRPAESGPRSGTRVSAATRLRVQEVARELGYTPNAIALAFRQQRTGLVGYFSGQQLLDLHLPFAADVINGLQRGCERHQQDLVLYGGFLRHSTNEIYAALSSGKIDGLVVYPTDNNPVVERLVRSHLPAVTITNPMPGLPAVVADEAGAAQLIATYLASRGHRRVLYRDSFVAHVSPLRRQQAFLRAAEAHGIEVVLSPAATITGELSPRELELITGPARSRPTAAVCWEDTNAYQLIASCRALGLRVPEDLAVAGFDGVASVVPPAHRLTSVRIPWAVIAETAIDLLMDLLAGTEAAPETVLPCTLQIGDSA